MLTEEVAKQSNPRFRSYRKRRLSIVLKFHCTSLILVRPHALGEPTPQTRGMIFTDQPHIAYWGGFQRKTVLRWWRREQQAAAHSTQPPASHLLLSFVCVLLYISYILSRCIVYVFFSPFCLVILFSFWDTSLVLTFLGHCLRPCWSTEHILGMCFFCISSGGWKAELSSIHLISLFPVSEQGPMLAGVTMDNQQPLSQEAHKVAAGKWEGGIVLPHSVHDTASGVSEGFPCPSVSCLICPSSA